jgi:hypothetical protein
MQMKYAMLIENVKLQLGQPEDALDRPVLEREIDLYSKLSTKVQKDLVKINKTAPNRWQAPPKLKIAMVHENFDKVIERIQPNSLEIEYIPLKNMGSTGSNNL